MTVRGVCIHERMDCDICRPPTELASVRAARRIIAHRPLVMYVYPEEDIVAIIEEEYGQRNKAEAKVLNGPLTHDPFMDWKKKVPKG